MGGTKESTRILSGVLFGFFTGLPFERVVGLGLAYCLITIAAIAFWILLFEWSHCNATLDASERWCREQREEIKRLRKENELLKAQLKSLAENK